MSQDVVNAMSDLKSNVSFRRDRSGGSGGAGGRNQAVDRAVRTGGAAAVCAASSFVARNMPSVTPPTSVARAIAGGVALVSCSIAVDPIVQRATR